MKKTHTIQKPHFKKILLKRLMIGMIIAAAVFAAALITATFVYKSYIYDEGQKRVIELEDYIDTQLAYYEKGESPYPDIDSLIIDANSHLVDCASFDAVENKPYIACRLLDKDKNVVGNSSWLFKLKVTGDDEQDSERVFLCHPDVYDEVYEAVEKYNKKIDSLSDDDRQYGLFVNEAYLDGKYFYPRLSIRSMSNDDFYKNGIGDWQEEEAVEFYPKDTSSMEYVEYKDKETQLYFTAREDHTDAAVESALDEYVKDKRYDDEYKNVFVFSYPYFSQKRFSCFAVHACLCVLIFVYQKILFACEHLRSLCISCHFSDSGYICKDKLCRQKGAVRDIHRAARDDQRYGARP
ncbi:MAG: hypothetical protein K6F27_10125 [Ruminococcus sp.]|nr:hypothetical protein [Ruminococcus sp.]